MKKILFGFILVFGIAIVYFASYANVVKLRSQELYRGLYETANIDEDFNPFLRFVTAYYLPTPIQTLEAQGLKVTVFIASEKDSERYTPLYVFFVHDPIESVVHATSMSQEDDQTRFLVKQGNNTLYDTDEDKSYDGLAISYGIEKYQGYYYIYAPLDETEHTYALYDFSGNEIANIALSAPYKEQVGVSYFNDLDYQIHYSQDEIIALMRLSDHMGSVYTNTAIFSGVMVFIGLIIFRKKR